MKHFLLSLTMLWAVTLTASAQPAQPADSVYNRLHAKALRFFDDGEWLNAAATYLLVLERQPTNIDAYAHVIVSNLMTDNTADALLRMQDAMEANVAVDSLVLAVRNVSFGTGNSNMYEHFLIDARQQFPYMSRNINRHLLDYYVFRDNGPMIVQYASAMLAGLPDDTRFMRLLARGYMLSGQFDLAVATWRRILDRHPNNLDALLCLANYYLATSRNADALPLLQRACAIAPTPYLQQQLDRLTHTGR